MAAERDPDRWLTDYTLLALRTGRCAREAGATALVDRYGVDDLAEQVETEEAPAAGRLAEDAAALAERLPAQGFGAHRAAFLGDQLAAVQAMAEQLNGAGRPLRELVRRCVGVEGAPVPETEFEAAHDLLDRALPNGAGPLVRRLEEWRTAHLLDDPAALPGLIERAAAETRRRTAALIGLPEEETEVRVVSGVAFHGAGSYQGGGRSVLYVNSDVPLNLADLFHLVSHEGHPGHIAEGALKEVHLVDGEGRTEQRVRFMPSPQFTVSEGLGLYAQAIAFPGDEAQRWLRENVLAERGITADGGDFAAIHEARNRLWGVWANAALLADEGRPEDEALAYLARWSLLSDAELAAARAVFSGPGGGPYIFAYHHGHRLLADWLDAPDRPARIRRLLTEQIRIADLAPPAEGETG